MIDNPRDSTERGTKTTEATKGTERNSKIILHLHFSVLFVASVVFAALVISTGELKAT
jgi:hypothetical protein